MTEEEKKAIWWLEEVVIDKDEYKKTHAWVGSMTLDYIETLLNLIQKQDRQIEKLKNKNKDLLRKLRNRVKEVNKLTKFSAYKREFSRLNAIIRQKDRQIDLMAEELSIFNHLSICEDCEKICENDYKYTDCNYCIKQYFAEQAKEVEE